MQVHFPFHYEIDWESFPIFTGKGLISLCRLFPVIVINCSSANMYPWARSSPVDYCTISIHILTRNIFSDTALSVFYHIRKMKHTSDRNKWLRRCREHDEINTATEAFLYLCRTFEMKGSNNPFKLQILELIYFHQPCEANIFLPPPLLMPNDTLNGTEDGSVVDRVGLLWTKRNMVSN